MGDVPSAMVPSVINHNGHEPQTPTELEVLTTQLNHGVPLHVLAKESTLTEGRIISVPFRDSQGWKIAAGMAGVTLTVSAAVVLYEATRKILEAKGTRNTPRK